MKVKLNNGQVTTVTRAKGEELILKGLGVAYTGNDPDEIAVRQAYALKNNKTEKIEITHRHISAEEE